MLPPGGKRSLPLQSDLLSNIFPYIALVCLAIDSSPAASEFCRQLTYCPVGASDHPPLPSARRNPDRCKTLSSFPPVEPTTIFDPTESTVSLEISPTSGCRSHPPHDSLQIWQFIESETFPDILPQGAAHNDKLQLPRFFTPSLIR